jgi:8-oxo-dGTP pyrophosphatase MutT (NUDIX family)
MKNIISAGLVLFYRDPAGAISYLLLRYPGGHWDFVKGKLEKDETNEQAAIRELYEETGLQATIYPGFFESLTYNFTDLDRQRAHKTVNFVIAQTTKQEIKMSHEHIDFAWLPYEEAVERLTYKNAKQILCNAYPFIKKIIAHQ